MEFWVLPVLCVSTVVNCEEMDLSQLSALLYSGMDLNVDPCDNFNDYVCSKWLEKNPSVAEYITSWDTEDMTKLNSFQIIRDILERDDIVDEKSKLYYEKKYYEACIGTSLTQEREIYLEIFSETNCIERSWQDVVKYYAKMIGETFLFQIILDDSKNLNLVEPYKSRTNLNPYELFDFSLVDNFFEYRYKISSIKNNEYREPFLEFMKNINELVYNDGELPSNSYTVEEFQELYDSNCPSINFNSKINWTELLQLHAGGNKNFLHPAFKITINIDYFSELCKILSSTSSLTVVQYMQFNFEYSFDVFACLHKGIGKNTSPERNALSSKSYNCINHLPMTHGISEEIMNTQEFVKRKTYVQKLMKYLKPILIKEINNSWIDDEQKNYALDIIQEIQLNVVNFKQDSDRYYLEDTSISYKNEERNRNDRAI
ncbi:neprilysin-11-like isoform X2 [Leptopilina heterotoma]|uniref:neprilysin-11-like isoform X2 n=1 Tax=Leptopilina heterotoma TaxID=63436 RepID=UPI001CA9A16B|nr:neprilysin-11-like isoform X2 [Leptopilina heterotoma]XP_043461740.1 neprilysin-11-like isoform X2 [Leptopilina heterotoma]